MSKFISLTRWKHVPILIRADEIVIMEDCHYREREDPAARRLTMITGRWDRFEVHETPEEILRRMGKVMPPHDD